MIIIQTTLKIISEIIYINDYNYIIIIIIIVCITLRLL